ncbi:MAG: hypothetical protein RKP46_08570 [Candidatus Accumulibacter sp.]|uniref:hypothetical protein n=1 Tax=Accumulibacter sp. TaxID=2053492 RepID=UPI00287849E5|nr:hypothetical protein [Accumulibacter sp.]MDS4014395.1 hypothetical protein [Accumulibacter sp.]
MRHYTTDSPEAMSRIVALALLADGALDPREIESLDRRAILDKLGISHGTLDRITHEFCNDLLQCARSPNVGQIELDRDLVEHLLDDIRAPEKQQQALAAIVEITEADGCLNGGEAILISEAMSRWGLELQHVARTVVRRAQRPLPQPATSV